MDNRQDRAESQTMNTLAFIASLVHSLAWPAVLIVLAALFREPIATQFPRVREAKWGKLSVKLQGADRLLKSAELELKPPTTEIHPSPVRPISPPMAARRQIIAQEPVGPAAIEANRPEGEEGLSIEAVAPGIQIDLAWQRLTRDVLAAARGTGLKGRTGLTRAVLHLSSKRLVPDAFSDAFERVKVTYKAIQKQGGAQVDESLTRDFVAACGRLEAHLAQIPTDDA
jgi:hypothetical protein